MIARMGRLRAVVDTNVFVSGTISPGGRPRQLLHSWYEGRFFLVLSADHYAELADVLGRSSIVKTYDVPETTLHQLLTALADTHKADPLPASPFELRDPKDEMLLAAALGGEADYLVTGDKDLHAVAGDPRLGTLQIVTISEFLAILDEIERQDSEAADRLSANDEDQDDDRNS
jgi:putative PIN family toxin of toxin-antitoxin system